MKLPQIVKGKHLHKPNDVRGLNWPPQQARGVRPRWPLPWRFRGVARADWRPGLYWSAGVAGREAERVSEGIIPDRRGARGRERPTAGTGRGVGTGLHPRARPKEAAMASVIPQTPLQRLYEQREILRARLRRASDARERARLDDALFELRCAIRAERERVRGVVWCCEGCGFAIHPTGWLEFCPECGGRWEIGKELKGQ